MKEALHPVSLEGAVEVDAPADFNFPVADAPRATSRYTYAVPTAALLTAACGGGGTSGSGTSSITAAGSATSSAQVVKKPSDAEAARFVLKASLSVSEAEIAEVKSKGYERWLTAQMDAAISQTGIAWMASRGYDQMTADNFFDHEYPGDYMIWNQLMSGANTVRKRIALALSEFFVVSLTGLDFSWRGQAIAHYWDQLNSNAFGNFRKLLEDVTLNPVMGYYLSTRGNRKENTLTGRVPDENFAREVMQLFTIGLYQLNNDGSRKLDANNQPIETYTNADVSNLARAFTGYDWDFTGNVKTPATGNPSRMINSAGYVLRPMTLDNRKWEFPSMNNQHSMLEATFLGTTIAANTDGTAALKTALDALFNHPNVGPFFSRQMIQRLVTSNPSAAYIGRVAKIFNNNGSGVRGDLGAVFKAILLDSEAMSAGGLTSPSFGKLREPILRLVQWAQTFGATSTSSNWQIRNLSDSASSLGQSALRSPSVFNFFRPGYVPPNTAFAANALVAPEFQLLNDTSAPGYVNFMTSAIGSGIGVGNDVKATYTSELAIAHDSAALLDRICLLMAANQISGGTKATIKTALDATTVTQTSTTAEKQQRVNLAVLLVMASPDYLVQK